MVFCLFSPGGKLPFEKLPTDDIRLPAYCSPSTLFCSFEIGPERGPFDDLICLLAGIGPILLKLGASYSKFADKLVVESQINLGSGISCSSLFSPFLFVVLPKKTVPGLVYNVE